MARPRSFDVDVVLDAASSVFRHLGYEAASVDDLVAATGLHRGSLYGAFGSKRGLFLAALTRAAATSAGRETSSDGPLGDDVLDLALVAALELAPRDPETRELVGKICERLDGPAGGRSGALGARLLTRAGLPHETTTTPTRSRRSS